MTLCVRQYNVAGATNLPAAAHNVAKSDKKSKGNRQQIEVFSRSKAITQRWCRLKIGISDDSYGVTEAH